MLENDETKRAKYFHSCYLNARLFEDNIQITDSNEMSDFIDSLDFSSIQQAASYRFAPSTKWKCIACLGIDIFIFHVTKVPMGALSDFFETECAEDEGGSDNEDEDDLSYRTSGLYILTV